MFDGTLVAGVKIHEDRPRRSKAEAKTFVSPQLTIGNLTDLGLALPRILKICFPQGVNNVVIYLLPFFVQSRK